MNEINVVPLVDVMSLLLIIFIITTPLLTHAVKIDLPKAESAPNLTQPDHIELAIYEDSRFFWNGELIVLEELALGLTVTVAESPETELHIRADKLAHYEHVARL